MFKNARQRLGYAEMYPPRVGSAGVLAKVEQFRWGNGDTESDVSSTDANVVLLAALAPQNVSASEYRERGKANNMYKQIDKHAHDVLRRCSVTVIVPAVLYKYLYMFQQR